MSRMSSDDAMQQRTIANLAGLYETSLRFGSWYGFEANCRAFCEAMRDVWGFDTVALFVGRDDRFENRPSDDPEPSLPCAYSTVVGGAEPEITLRDPSVSARVFSGGGGSAWRWTDLVALEPSLSELHPGGVGGWASLLPVARTGVVVCVDATRQAPPEGWEILRFRGLLEQLTATLRANRALERDGKTGGLSPGEARDSRASNLGELARGVAHDLNNVLGPIRAYPELIRPYIPSDSRALEFLDRMETSAQHASEVIDDLLAVARAGTKQADYVLVQEVVKEYGKTSSFVELRTEQPGVAVQFLVERDLPPIQGVASSINRVLVNLVTNAFEELGASGSVRVVARRVQLERPHEGFRTIPAGDYVVLETEDNGGGIRARDLERVFDPYYTTKGTDRAGSGFGLAVVSELVGQLGGHLDVISSPAGTRFSLHFPVARRRKREAHTATKPPTTEPNAELRATVLVVDDDADQRELAMTLLDGFGCKVLGAGSEAEALRVFEGDAPDIVLLDVVLSPGAGDPDGVDLLRRMRAHRTDFGCVLQSGFAQPDRVEQGLQLGASEFVRKPYTPLVLRQAIHTALKRTVENVSTENDG